MTANKPTSGAPVVRLRDLHPTLRLRLVIAFIERGLNTMVIPLMAIYLSATLGPGTAGLLILASVGFAVVAGLASGHLADVLGRRWTLLAGAVTMTVGFGGMALAAAPWWSAPLAVFAFYLLQAGAASFIQPVHEALIMDVTVPAERNVVYTINYWSFNIALATGALLGGFLYERHMVGLLVGASALALGATLLTYRFLQETAPPRERDRTPRPPSGTIREIVDGYAVAFKDRRFMVLFLAMTFILGLELQRTSGYVAVRIAEDVPTQSLLPAGLLPGLPEFSGIQLLAILQALNTAGVVLLALVSERLLWRFDNHRRILIGVVLFTAACTVLATSNVAVILLLAVFVLTVGELMHIPVMQTVLADVVPEGSRTRYMAVFQLTVRGGMVISSLSLSIGAFLSPWSLAAIYVMLGLGAAMLYHSLTRHSGPARVARG